MARGLVHVYVHTHSIHKFHGESRSEVLMHHLGIKSPIVHCSLASRGSTLEAMRRPKDSLVEVQ